MKMTESRFFAENVYCTVEGRMLRVANLSPGGLFAATARPPEQGQIVLLELQLGRKEAFRVMGEVSWVNRGRDPKSHDLPEGFGVRFTRIAATDREAIVEVLRRSDPVLRGTQRRSDG
jgi:Tfp pilus assembly protein PilZ